MQFPLRFSIPLAIALCAFAPIHASAHDIKALDDNLCRAVAAAEIMQLEAPATLTILSPREGETLRSPNFDLVFTMQGALSEARLDHIHWKLSEFDNITAPDLTGVINIAAPREGDHFLTVYMATPEHVVITQKYQVNFRIVTRGVIFLSPQAEANVTSSDLNVSYTSFGEIPASTRVILTLDESSNFEDPDGDGNYVIRGLTDGSHSLRVWLMSADGVELGDGETRGFTIASTLSAANASRAYRALKKVTAATKSVRAKRLNQLRKILEEMLAGGEENPGLPKLNQANIQKALQYTNKLLKSSNNKPVLEKLNKLLKKLN